MKSTSEQMKFTKEDKMTMDSHFKGSKKDLNRRQKRENGKVNGICEQLTDKIMSRRKLR